MSRILIIGGTGNIGSGITRLLLEKGGHEIIHVNRGLRPEIAEGVKTLRADRTDFQAFKKTVESEGNLDCVIDMICDQPEQASQAVELFKGRTGQYIFCSTVDVYDRRNLTYPIHEDQPVGWINPRFESALKKAVCEEAFNTANDDDFHVSILRPAMTYGEGMGLIHLFGWDTYFIDRIRRGKPIILHGDGTSIWVLAHRDDVAAAFVNAVGNPAAYGKKYNVTGQEMLTWTQYYSYLAWSNGYQEPEFVYIPTANLLKMEPEKSFRLSVTYAHNQIYDNSAAIRDLGYEYTVDWLEGAARVIAWLEENKKIEACENFPFYDSIIDRWGKISDIGL